MTFENDYVLNMIFIITLILYIIIILTYIFAKYHQFQTYLEEEKKLS